MGWGATINCHVTEFTQYTCWLVDRVVFKAIAIPTPFSGKRHFVKMKLRWKYLTKSKPSGLIFADFALQSQ